VVRGVMRLARDAGDPRVAATRTSSPAFDWRPRKNGGQGAGRGVPPRPRPMLPILDFDYLSIAMLFTCWPSYWLQTFTK
jgi:hypothetical protein